MNLQNFTLILNVTIVTRDLHSFVLPYIRRNVSWILVVYFSVSKRVISLALLNAPFMFSLHSYEKDLDVIFDSASLPYYILNTNEDIKVMTENREIAISCFPNEIDFISKTISDKSGNQISKAMLLTEENRELSRSTSREDKQTNKRASLNEIEVVTCPHRNNLLEYTQWYINNVEMISKKLKKSSCIIEVPLIPIKYFYSRLLPLLESNFIYRIYKSSYFNPFIDCLYIQNITEITFDGPISSIKISNYLMFQSMFKNLFESYIHAYLIGMSKVAAYITRGNFYGQEMLKFKQIKNEYIQSLLREMNLSE